VSFEVSKERVVEFLRELSDEAYQRRVWLASSGPEVSSFVEAFCGLFDDTGLADQLDNARHPVIFSSKIDDHLRRFGRFIDQINPPLDAMPPVEVIKHPAMAEIRRMAAAILAEMIEQEGKGRRMRPQIP
jgi:hypothetical protein